MPAPTLHDPIAEARAAYDRHEWARAFDLLSAADSNGELGAEQLELLGQTAWWCGRIDDCISARERAFTAYLEAGDEPRAGFVAVQLARDNENRGARSIGNAWFRRAEKLLADHPETVEFGYLETARSHKAAGRGDHVAAVEASTRALEIATRAGDRDLQAMALVRQGFALVSRGDVEEGFGLIDEATVAAVGGELSAFTTGSVYCITIGACAGVADYRRAGEWTEAARRWCERQSISGFPGICRVHRAEIMRLRGWWTDAERDARDACTALEGHGLPVFAGDGFNELGMIRLAMGDLDQAEDAFRQAHELGHDPQPGMALAKLARGDASAAVAMLSRALAEAEERLTRARLLPVMVEAALTSGDAESADRAATELEGIARTYGTEALHASAACSRAAVQLHLGQSAEALASARRGWRLWHDLDTPYEAALARICVALAYRATGDPASAELELDAARSAFERLGAGLALRRIASLSEQPPAEPARVSRAFMFTDIERSTNLVDALGDEAWERLLGWHDRTLRALFAGHGGEEVDHTGDGFFVAFADATAALTCAIEIQRALAEHARSQGFAPRLRIGVHLAEATGRGKNYGGRGVHEAARIAAAATGGEILASVATVEAGGDGWATSEPRTIELKGITEPARVVSIDWGEAGASRA